MRKLMISIVFSLMLFSLLTSFLYAEERILGAFGMNLGDKFDPSTAIGVKEWRVGDPWYQFNPTNKFRYFEKYYVSITPKTHKIYCIQALGEMENGEKAANEQKFLTKLLKQKYKVEENPFTKFFSLGDTRIHLGNRYIVLSSGIMLARIDNMLSPSYSKTLPKIYIRYCSESLSALARKERLQEEEKQLEIEASKVDSSDL